MKKLLMIIFLLGVLGVGQVEASVLTWPVVGQVAKVGMCVIADSGSILKSATVHATGFGIDVLTIVGKCTKFVLNTVTPGLIPDPD